MGTTVFALTPMCMSLQDASVELACSEDTVRRLIAQKKLAASRVGRRLVVRRDSLENFLLSNSL